MITFDADDLPSALGSAWGGMVTLMLNTGACSPQLARYRRNRHELNQQRRLTRPSRAKDPALRAYGGVLVVVRRSVRERIAELRAKRRAA